MAFKNFIIRWEVYVYHFGQRGSSKLSVCTILQHEIKFGVFSYFFDNGSHGVRAYCANVPGRYTNNISHSRSF